MEKMEVLVEEAIKLAEMYVNEANKCKSEGNTSRTWVYCAMADNLADLASELEEYEEDVYYIEGVRALFDAIKADMHNPLCYRALCNSFF